MFVQNTLGLNMFIGLGKASGLQTFPDAICPFALVACGHVIRGSDLKDSLTKIGFLYRKMHAMEAYVL